MLVNSNGENLHKIPIALEPYDNSKISSDHLEVITKWAKEHKDVVLAMAKQNRFKKFYGVGGDGGSGGNSNSDDEGNRDIGFDFDLKKEIKIDEDEEFER